MCIRLVPWDNIYYMDALLHQGILNQYLDLNKSDGNGLMSKMKKKNRLVHEWS